MNAVKTRKIATVTIHGPIGHGSNEPRYSALARDNDGNRIGPRDYGCTQQFGYAKKEALELVDMLEKQGYAVTLTDETGLL